VTGLSKRKGDAGQRRRVVVLGRGGEAQMLAGDGKKRWGLIRKH